MHESKPTPMTPADILLIRSSWAAVEAIADDAAKLFFARLFQLDPRLSALFRYTDMEKQRMVLMQTLTVVVRNIDRLEQLMPEVEALGRRHVGYGVRADHYATVGSALLWTIQQCLADEFTDETGYAWADAYRRVSSAMIEAARLAEIPSAPRTRRRWRAPAPLPLGLAMGSVST
jgi:hemoglobin-like flavoprotein